MSQTVVTSFVIRFRQEQTGGLSTPPWRGLIRHIQTSQEAHFTCIEDAVDFIAQFVEVSYRSEREVCAPEA